MKFSNLQLCSSHKRRVRKAGKKGEQRNKLIGSAYGDLQQLLLAQLINAIEDLAVNFGKDTKKKSKNI